MITGTPVAVTTPGTPVAFSATQILVRKLLVQAYRSTGAVNAGNVTIGDSTVRLLSKPGIILTPGASAILDFDAVPLDLSKLCVDSATASDGVVFNYITTASRA